ncbi:hypothetical protein HHL08_14210 [Sphingobium sp. AR-3-1]|uniref:Uncharacterized protein n=1 Tax=Sphingobium psychrophilum TaxID=2728834 RepID=A0A7X9WWQ6_9SPHN|nr:hypothetical protein [Sphingobium psychrophilum]NML11285.1 hypothetical protein [Sphingobium psychrophilum]
MSSVERVARAMCADAGFDPNEIMANDGPRWRYYEPLAIAALKELRDPSELQWGGLAWQIIMWMDMKPTTPRTLFRHLECSGREVPQWLRDEPEMKSLDHTPSKGTRAALVYRAMIDAAIGEG